MKPVDDIEKLIQRIDVAPRGEMDQRTLRDIKESHEKAAKASRTNVEQESWRELAKSRRVQLAVAAAIMIAILIGINQFGGLIDGADVAWGMVVDRIETAETVSYKSVFKAGNTPATTIRVTYMAPYFLRRQELPDGKIDIYNYPERKHLTLYPESKFGKILEYANVVRGANELPADVKKFFGGHPWEWFRRKYEKYGEFTGQAEIDGRPADVFFAEYGPQTIKVWTDHETKLPVRAEIDYVQYPRNDDSHPVPLSYVLSEFVWNTPVDESLFSISAPAGYRVEHRRIDVSEATEQALVEGLRAFAELYDGRFPDDLGEDAAINITTDFMNAKASKHLTSDQRIGIYQQFLKVKTAVEFVQKLNSDNDWLYAGKDIKHGDTKKAIFWYRPVDSETYRLIYGDLTIEDVSPEDLPR